MDNRPIGIFDSGLGGVTVLVELNKVLPDESFIYLGDTKNSPYGEKTKEELKVLVDNNIKFLESKNVKAIIIACNTASSLGMEYFRNNYSTPFISVIEAGVKEVSEKDRKVLIAATKATIESGKYNSLLSDKFDGINIEGVACPDIVPAIEFSDLDTADLQNVVDGYLLDYANKGFDSLILGCTHFPILEREFSKALPGVRLINPARKTAMMTRDYLEKHNMLCSKRIEATIQNEYYVSGDENLFKEKFQRIFEKKMENIQKLG